MIQCFDQNQSKKLFNWVKLLMQVCLFSFSLTTFAASVLTRHVSVYPRQVSDNTPLC